MPDPPPVDTPEPGERTLPLPHPATEGTVDATHGSRVAPDPRDREGRPFGRYRLRREVGRGGMGIVWEAWDTSLRRVVALKQILSGPDLAPDQVERFQREARLAAKLSHASIVGILDVGEHDGVPYLTQEFVRGRSLAGVLEGPVPIRQAVQWVKSIAEGLQYAHDQGVVHRDVKPGNILIDEAGAPRVTDFGLAKEVGQSPSAALTMSGALVGTPQYMSPEQASGRTQDVGPASDQFSLGVVFYEALTGRLPFEGGALRALLNAICDREPDRPSKLRAEVDLDLETLCLKPIEKDPARRYARLGDLADDLGRYLAGEPIRARPMSMARRVARGAWRGRRVFLPALLLGILGVAFAVREAALAADRRRTETAQEAERTALEEAARRSQRVADVLLRWSALGDAIRRLEEIRYDSRLSNEEASLRAREPWPAIEEFLEVTPADSASRATATALVGWAECLAGREEQGIARMRSAASMDPEVAHGRLLEALVRFARYVEAQGLPDVFPTAGGIRFGEMPGETPSMIEDRQRIEALLGEVGNARRSESGGAESFVTALDAMRALQTGRLDRAEEDLSSSLAAPELALFHTGLRYARAKVRFLRKELTRAVEDLEAVGRARPAHASRFLTAGLVRLGVATELLATGKDSRPALREAIADFGRVVELLPSASEGFVDRGVAWQRLGDAEGIRGGSPWEPYDRAESDFKEALRLRPDDPSALMGLGILYRNRGEEEAQAGRDPRGTLDRAVEALDAAVGTAPESLEARLNRAAALHTRGSAGAQVGEDPLGFYTRAIEDLEAVLLRRADDAGALRARALIGVERGMWEAAQGGDPRGSYEVALADFDRVVALSPGTADYVHDRGVARLQMAAARTAAGEDPSEDFRKAAADFSAAIERKPSTEAFTNRAAAWTGLAEAEAAAGGDPATTVGKALADLDAAIGRNPRNWRARMSQGMLLERQGRVSEAIDAYKAALKVVPGEPTLQGLLDRAKEKLKDN